jgi:hypothetical protein
MPDRQRLLSALIAPVCITAMWRRKGWSGALAIRVPCWLLLRIPAAAILAQRLRTI